MDTKTLVTAAQIEQGLRFYGCAYHPDDERGSAIRLVKSYMTFEPGDLIICENDGRLYVLIVSQVREDVSLRAASTCDIWAIGTANNYASDAKQLRERERNAEQRLARSIALREATEAMAEIGMDSSTLFSLTEDKG